MSVTVTASELEYHDDAANSHKFYRVYSLPNTDLTQWGRVGAVGAFKLVAKGTGNRKRSEKENEGYQVTVQNLRIDITDTISNNVEAGYRNAFDDLYLRFEQERGNGVATGTVPNASKRQAMSAEKVQAKKEDALLSELLSVASDLGLKTEPDPDSMEAKLAAQLAKARGQQ